MPTHRFHAPDGADRPAVARWSAARPAHRYSPRTAVGRLRLGAHAEGVALLLLVFVGGPWWRPLYRAFP